MIYMDANSHFDLQTNGAFDKCVYVDTNVVGNHNLGKENRIGVLIRESLKAWNMVLLHTYKQLPPTFYSNTCMGSTS